VPQPAPPDKPGKKKSRQAKPAERRALSSRVGLSVIKARLNAGRDRIAAEKRATDEAAAKTSTDV
jgi:hypothetical protein